MIITKAQVKAFTGITSTTYDNQIDALIEPVLFDIFDYTKNYFHNNAVKLRAQYTFSTTGTIVVSGTNFSTYSFQSGDEIHIIDSKRNDGVYTASIVSNDTITISTTQTLKAEALECAVTIVKMDVPKSLLPIAANMVKFKIDTPLGTPQSESLGDYSVSYGTSGSAYPSGLTQSLNNYRCVGFI